MATRSILAQPRIRAALAVAIACNLVLLIAYVWSRGGQTTDIRIEVVGDQFTVIVDGRERLRERLPAADQGSVRVSAPNPNYRPSALPTMGEIEHVRVTSMDGEILFETTNGTGDPEVASHLEPRRWRDYAVDIKYRNAMEADVALRVNGTDAVTVSMRRSSLISSAVVSLSSSRSPQRFFPVASTSLEVDPWESAKGATAAVLRPYPLVLGLALVAAMTGLVMAKIPSANRPLGTFHVPKHIHALAVFAIALAVSATTVYLLLVQHDGVVTVPDEAAYIFQARILASGRTHLDTPPVPAAFDVFYPSFIVDHGGRWASFYTAGHPLALVPGVMVGAPWLVPPLLAGANVLLIYALAQRTYGRWTALFAAALLAGSPFFLMQASSYMAHNTAIAYMLASLLSVVSLRDRPLVSGSLGGAFFGLMFLARPLSAVMLAAPLAVLLLTAALPRPERKRQIQRIAAFALLGGIMLVLYFAYNWSTTGDTSQNGYQASGALGSAFGFSGSHGVASGLDNEFQNIVALLLVLNGWPAWLGLAFVLMPFVLGTRNPFDWFLLVASLFIIGSASLFFTTSMFNGPRYIYEAVPFLVLLSARGFACLAAIPDRIAGERVHASTATSLGFPQIVASSAGFALVAASALGWVLSSESRVEILPIPPSAAYKAHHPLLDDRLIEDAERLQITNALVVVRPCFGILRNCYLSVFLENNLGLDGDIVWVSDVGELNQEVVALYPCRSLYVADYDARTITRTGTTPPLPGETCS